MSYQEWHKLHPFQIPTFSKSDDIQWITVRGAHIPIKDGQSKEEAIKEHLGHHEPGSRKPEKGSPPDEKTLPKELHEEFKNHPRDKSLKGEHSDIQEASIHKYLLQKEHLRDKHIKEHGKIANADDARKHFKDVGYEGHNSADVQEASSALNKEVWRKVLGNKGKHALIYAGGSGTGKTSAIQNVLPKDFKNAAAILDGNLSSLKSARDRIKESVEAGKRPKIVYVYREPEDAWTNGVIKRMNKNKEEGGRVVPLSVFLNNHEGSQQVVKALADEGIDIKYVDNSLGDKKAELMSVDKFNKISYNKEELRKQLEAATKKAYDNKDITKQQYNALIR